MGWACYSWTSSGSFLTWYSVLILLITYFSSVVNIRSLWKFETLRRVKILNITQYSTSQQKVNISVYIFLIFFYVRGYVYWHLKIKSYPWERGQPRAVGRTISILVSTQFRLYQSSNPNHSHPLQEFKEGKMAQGYTVLLSQQSAEFHNRRVRSSVHLVSQ